MEIILVSELENFLQFAPFVLDKMDFLLPYGAICAM